MDGALASRARRPRGARSGDLHDRLVMRPDERAELTRALRAAGALTPALLLRSLLGGERSLSPRSGGTVGPAAAARRRLYPRAAGGRLRRARPPGWPQGRRPACLSRRARRDQSSGAPRVATGSNCRWCKRSSTLASCSTILRSPRFGRSCGASPPKRRRRKRRLRPRGGELRLQPVGRHRSWNFRPSTTIPSRAEAGLCWPPTGGAMLELAAPSAQFGRG